MNKVNPPRQLRLPPSISSNPDLRRAFDDRDYILFQLWVRSGGGADFTSDLQSGAEFAHTLSKLFDIRQQIGSDKPVTIDTTGFTIDTTEQTTDKTEV